MKLPKCFERLGQGWADYFAGLILGLVTLGIGAVFIIFALLS